jgi:hypothetical protein
MQQRNPINISKSSHSANPEHEVEKISSIGPSEPEAGTRGPQLVEGLIVQRWLEINVQHTESHEIGLDSSRTISALHVEQADPSHHITSNFEDKDLLQPKLSVLDTVISERASLPKSRKLVRVEFSDQQPGEQMPTSHGSNA